MSKRSSVSSGNLKEIEKKLQKIREEDDAVPDFIVELEKMRSLDPKRKILWSQIYKNAIDERASAAMLFGEAYAAMTSSAADHVSLGSTLVRYLERMSKANQQLLDLSSLMTQEEAENTRIDPEKIWAQIEEEK
jgi:hypothetical protein